MAMMHVVATPIANPIAIAENNKQNNFFVLIFCQQPAKNDFRTNMSQQ